MKEKLLDILVCPACKQKMSFDKSASELLCEQEQCKLAFPVIDDIPVLLIDQARNIKK